MPRRRAPCGCSSCTTTRPLSPELPEVESARALIERYGLGRPIAAVDDSDTYVTRPHVRGEIDGALAGRSIVAANRRGKSIWLQTSDDGPVLGLHLGMAGRIVIDGHEAGDPKKFADRPRWDRFTIAFADGGSLILRDPRRLGRARLEPDIDALGPDAQTVSRDEFRERVRRGRGPLKARIMDQSVIAGVGNLLADEALWQARLHPRRPANEVTDAEADALRRAIRAAARSAIRLGGSHRGAFIPARTRDGHCPRCGEPLERAQVGGRTTYWCPREQV